MLVTTDVSVALFNSKLAAPPQTATPCGMAGLSTVNCIVIAGHLTTLGVQCLGRASPGAAGELGEVALKALGGELEALYGG